MIHEHTCNQAHGKQWLSSNEFTRGKTASCQYCRVTRHFASHAHLGIHLRHLTHDLTYLKQLNTYTHLTSPTISHHSTSNTHTRDRLRKHLFLPASRVPSALSTHTLAGPQNTLHPTPLSEVHTTQDLESSQPNHLTFISRLPN